MPLLPHCRRAPLSLALALACSVAARAQKTEMNTPVATPAGSQAQSAAAQAPPPPRVSERDRRAADDAYLQGARAIGRQEYAVAEEHFGRAVKLDPNNTDYARALLFARQGRVVELIHAATKARFEKDPARAQKLLDEAHALDPDNRLVIEHLSAGGEPNSPAIDPLRFPAANIASTLAGATQLKDTPGKHSFHERGDAVSLLRAVYGAWGIDVVPDDEAPQINKPLRFDLEDADFNTATTLAHTMTRSFAATLQPNRVILAKDTQENRDRLTPLVEETIYLRGMTNEQMQEYANLARNIYDVKNVTASATGGTILLRADEPTLKLVNAAYADMLDGGSDVLLDVNLYELDKEKVRNFGVTTPTSASVFPVYTELQSAITANQSTLDTAISSGLITLTGNTQKDLLTELGYLYVAGLLSSAQSGLISGLLGTIGNYGGFPLAGVSIGSGATVNAQLTVSDSRLLDAIHLRGGNNQATQFRSGTRYPITTSTYTTGVSSSVASALAGITVNGVSAATLAAQYGYGASSTTIPQIQYEDLGLTLKATPAIQRNGDVRLVLDLKLSALGATSLNGIPVINNRQFSSTVAVPNGQSALLVSEISRSEIGAVSGLPGLNDLPGFQGTNKDIDNSKTELLITITPHVVRQGGLQFTSRRVMTPHPAGPGQ